MNKAELRTQMRAMRRAIPADEQARDARALHAQVMAFEPYSDARVVMAYMACRGELSLAPVMEDALAAGKTLLLPRCEAPGLMTARRICSLADLAPGAYGLPEPKEDCAIVQPQKIDLILVPGAAFDREGRRLGQGGGYYDRFLEKSGAVRAGICHDAALLERVPAEAHDIPMEYVITPSGIIHAR